MRSVEILERLIAFPTVSRDQNLDLIEYVRTLLSAVGVDSVLTHNDEGTKANLYTTIGPADRPGVMLSGHTDVVPVEGQDWSSDPFRLREAGGLLYGRGAADMKGFVACALAAAEAAAARRLKTPLHIALSYDEEIGCVGVHRMIDMLEAAPVKPAIAIVGEPTSLAVATGHKGKAGFRAICRGREGHSALAPLAMNAVHLAAEFVNAVRAKQAELAAAGVRDDDYDVPYTTLHVGRIEGGVALNIVPNRCDVLWEIRNLAEDDAGAIEAEIRSAAAAIVAAAEDADAAIEIERYMGYPGLATPPDADVVAFVRSLTGSNGRIKVAFGTEGGLFADRLGVQTVVCGPGSMAQGHKPDEFLALEQIERCDAMLAQLLTRLEAGL